MLQDQPHPASFWTHLRVLLDQQVFIAENAIESTELTGGPNHKMFKTT